MLLFLLGIFSANCYTQDFDFRNYLLLGVEPAEDLTSVYLSPLSEGLTYALTGGWYNSAVVKDRWSLDLALVSNGSFIPSDRLSKEINISTIENLEVLGGGDIVIIPTIIGSSDSRVTLIATVDNEQFEFDTPTGIGLLNINLLPSAFLQASVGLPANSEFSFRYVPKIKVSDISLGVLGAGIKHELSKTIKGLEKSPVAVAGMIAFTRLDTDYEFQAEGFVTGENQSVNGFLNTWLFEVIASTKSPIYNFYGGLGYVSGKSEYALRGTYIVETDTETLVFRDPFDVQNSVSGWRFNAGAKVRMGWFSLNLGYTFQGFNNLSLGINFNVYSSNKVQTN